MSIKNKIKFALYENNKSNSSIAEALNITNQAVSNKFNRDSFSAADLVKIANILGYELAFVKNNQKIVFDMNDIKVGE